MAARSQLRVKHILSCQHSVETWDCNIWFLYTSERWLCSVTSKCDYYSLEIMTTWMYTHSHATRPSDWRAYLRKRVHHKSTMQVSVVLTRPLRGLTFTMPHSPVRRNITGADIKPSHVKRAGGGAKPCLDCLAEWRPEVVSHWLWRCRRRCQGETVRLLGRSPYVVRGAAGTAGCSGLTLYICAKKNYCGLKQTLVMIFLSLHLQVLEEISCYPENHEAKELRRILTQPHFMVSRKNTHNSRPSHLSDGCRRPLNKHSGLLAMLHDPVSPFDRCCRPQQLYFATF